MKKLLAIALALGLLSTPVLATGYWTAELGHTVSGVPACYAYTRTTNGIKLGIGITAENQELFAFLQKPSWHIPQSQEINIDIAIDDSPTITAPGRADYRLSDMVILPVKQEYARLFIHMISEGDNLYIRFHGSEPDWNLSLWGTRDTYAQFERCARRIAPDWAYRIDRSRQQQGTQPY